MPARDLVAAALFLWGYLHVRPVLPNASTYAAAGPPRAHDRLVLVILDGLRRDYVAGPAPWLTTPGRCVAEASH